LLRSPDADMQFVPRRGFANLPGAGKPLPATQIKRAAFFPCWPFPPLVASVDLEKGLSHRLPGCAMRRERLIQAGIVAFGLAPVALVAIALFTK